MASLIARLRSLVPLRTLNRYEALRVAELQARFLLREANLTQPPVPESLIQEIPRLQVERLPRIPVSGSTHWMRGRWVIVLDSAEPAGRQRFSLAHEFKHVLDAPFITYLYLDSRGVTSAARMEQVADYFAASLLMPRAWVHRAWASGMTTVPALANKFGVSYSAMRVRLLQLGMRGLAAGSQTSFFRTRKVS